MIKILFISGSLAQNGTEMFMMNVLRHIDRSKYHIDFCIYNSEITPNRIEAESLGCKVYVFPSRRESPIKTITSTWKFFKEHGKEYDVVHWNGGNLSSVRSLIIARLFHIPVRIVHAHSSSAVGIHNKILHKINRLFIPFLCNEYFACSSEAKKFFYGNLDKAVIINNGIDVENFDYNFTRRSEIRRELGVSKDCIVLGHVGRFDDNKNHQFLVKTFHQFYMHNNNSRLLLVGNGETFNDIKDLVKELGLNDKVIFTGLRSDVFRVMQAMDAFIMPSKFEGLPFVLVEAQCSGLPCIISDSINHDVKLTDNVFFESLRSGELFWSEKIDKILSNYERKSQASIITSKGFSMKDTVRFLEKVYSRLAV